jgi:hypothetical protein
MNIRPRVWFNSLFPALKSWERAAIQAWLNDADPETRDVGNSQLGLINLVRRGVGGRDVYLYYFQYGLYRGNYPRLFNIPDAEKQVAQVRMLINSQKVTARISVVARHIFELNFSKLPPLFLRKAHVEILDVNTGPFPSDRKRDELAASLPPDYVDLVKAAGPTGPDEKDGIGVLTLDQVYLVTIEGEQYWMLAEKPDIGMLGVRVEGDDRNVYFLFYDGPPPTPLSPSFREALEKARDID